ncbi:hypothetical protein ABIB85_007457 [Bradyrhizobium sp. JR1.5]
MTKPDCVIVRAYGRQLDQLRSEASRISKGRKIDWWVERADAGTQFCFEDTDTTKAFASICESLAIACRDV